MTRELKSYRGLVKGDRCHVCGSIRYNGEYIYKFSELPDKKFNGSETIYDMLNEDTYNFVVLEDDKRINLFKQYQSENINISYVQWLENKVLEDD
jgi:hypothetical protein